MTRTYVAPPLLAESIVRARTASEASWSPSKSRATPSVSSAVGRHGLSGPSSVPASSASACMRSIPAGHMNARSSAVHGRIEALPSGNGPS